jgi:hypothetical protein
MAVTFETAAELVQRLVNIPLERICFTLPLAELFARLPAAPGKKRLPRKKKR